MRGPRSIFYCAGSEKFEMVHGENHATLQVLSYVSSLRPVGESIRLPWIAMDNDAVTLIFLAEKYLGKNGLFRTTKCFFFTLSMIRKTSIQ